MKKESKISIIFTGFQGMYEPCNIQHSLSKILHNQHLEIFSVQQDCMIMNIQGDHIHDFFTDPVYENLLDYLKDSAVPSSSPAVAGQDPQEQRPSAPVGNYAGTQSIELAVRT